MRFFIIPGNPPALHFYKLWAQEIQLENSDCSICISPYPYISIHTDSSKYLSNTAAVHRKKLLNFHKTVKEKVVVIGHSVGAWMALRLLEEEEAIIENCFLLYPFLQQPSLKGRAVLKSIHLLYPIPFFKSLLFGCRNILERLFKDLRYVTDDELRSSIALAYHEYNIIGRSQKALEIPQQLRKRLYMIYCDQDTWCPSHTVNEIKKLISSEKLDTRHDFITSQEERAIVLKALLHRIYNQASESTSELLSERRDTLRKISFEG